MFPRMVRGNLLTTWNFVLHLFNLLHLNILSTLNVMLLGYDIPSHYS
jgi:hypothetical protein